MRIDLIRFEKRIHIPLPDVNARAAMFPIHIGSTPHSLHARDFRMLAEKTEGFSGADIETLVREALYQPIRKIQSATHFKAVRAPDRMDPTREREYLTPCSPGDAGAKEMTWHDVEGDELLEPPLTVKDFIKAAETSKPTVNEVDLEKHRKFTEDFGQEG